MRKLITTLAVAAIVVVGTGGGCDPGDPNGGGKPMEVTIWITPGSHTITKQYYGIWSAVTDAANGAGAKPSCRWSITKNGKVVGSGGWKDHIVIGTGVRGGTVTVGAACYKFEK